MQVQFVNDHTQIQRIQGRGGKARVCPALPSLLLEVPRHVTGLFSVTCGADLLVNALAKAGRNRTNRDGLIIPRSEEKLPLFVRKISNLEWRHNSLYSFRMIRDTQDGLRRNPEPFWSDSFSSVGGFFLLA